MNIAILSLGIVGAILLVLTIYSFMTSGKHFKPIAFTFLATAITLFILVIIKKIREQMGSGKK